MRRMIVAGLVGSVLVGCSGESERPITDVACPVLVAHRGASHLAPENTMAAFELAWALGADAIEGDFHLTADGVIVCHHDASMAETAGVDVVIADSTFGSLQGLDVGRWKGEAWAGERVPTLGEVLGSVPAAGGDVFIEVKCGVEIVPRLLEVMAASGLASDRMTVISFNEAVIAAVEAADASLRTLWLTDFETKRGGWHPTAAEVVATAVDLGADGVDVRGNLNVVDAAFMDAMSEAGLEVHVWTVNDPGVAAAFGRLGVGSVTTDRPGWLRGRFE